MNTLNEKAMLISLSVSYWGAKVTDDSVVEELTTGHQTEREVHDYRKRLAPAEEVRKFKVVRSRARAYLRDKTLPWIDGGTRILPSPLYLDVAKKLREFHTEWESVVSEFFRKFPAIKAAEKKRQGSLYNDDDYPTVDSLRRKFGWDVSVFPIPSKDDWRVNVGDKEAVAIKKQIESRVKEALSVATKDLWRRLHEVVESLAKKMRESDPTFRDSIIENIRDLVGLLPDLNVADDPRLEEMRRKVEAELAKLNPDELREDGKMRKQTADAADAILKAMSGYVGDVK